MNNHLLLQVFCNTTFTIDNWNFLEGKIMSAENLTKTIDPKLDLEKIKRECESMIKSKAKMSAVAEVVPVPLLDVAVDATLL